MNKPSIAPITLEDAKKLVLLLEQGDNLAATELLNTAHSQTSIELFAEVGKLTRQLHDKLNDFHMDERIASMANEDIPDAQARLNYVIEATEEAANKTMDLVDTCTPIAENLHKQIAVILPKWKKLRESQVNFDGFTELCSELDVFLEEGNSEAAKLSSLLTEVLMAQGYQDLTGQVIRRVIELVKEVENNLVHMLTMFSSAELSEHAALTEKPKKSAKVADKVVAEGPIMGGQARDDVASDQDDVDDLLSSLGF